MTTLVENYGNLAVNLVSTLGYFGIMIGTAFLPSEIIMPIAGFTVSQGKMTLWGITIAAALGDVIGSLIVYFIADFGGRPLLEKYGKYILVSHDKLEQADRWFEKYGSEAVLISKLLPIMGRFISLPAGVAKMDLKKFIIYTFFGSIPFAFVLGYFGVKLGNNWYIIRQNFYIIDILVIIVLLGILFYYIFFKKKLFKNKSKKYIQ